MAQLTYSQVDQDILQAMRSPGWRYYVVLLADLVVLGWGMYAWRYQIVHGMGVSGLTHPVMWAIYITNFVFWVGIAHSGTLISARQRFPRSGTGRSFLHAHRLVRRRPSFSET